MKIFFRVEFFVQFSKVIILIHFIMIKAVVNTKSNYRNFNGLTFPVVEFLLRGNKPGIALEIPTESGARTADFSLDEITLVNYQKICQTAYEHYTFGGPSYCSGKHYLDLRKYAQIKGIKFEPKYPQIS